MKKNNIILSSIFVSLLLVMTAVFSAGFHYPSEIFPGTFTGNYSFMDGNVGIGTTIPQAKLEVNGIDNDAIKLSASNYGSGSLRITGEDKNIGGTVSSFYHTVRFKTDTHNDNNGNGVERDALILYHEGWGGGHVASFPTGNVGIGTTNPGANLQINSPTGGTIRLQYTGNSGFSQLSTDIANSLILGTVNSPSSLFIQDITGNVGIGTTNPFAKLTVYANPQTTRPLYIYTDDDNNGATKNPLDWQYVPGIMISNNWDGDVATVDSTKISKIVLNTAAGGYNNGASIHVEGAGGYNKGQLIFSTGWDSNNLATERMRINTLGYVGIGTSTPGQKLDIVGGNGRVQSGYSWLTNSDVRYKTNIETIDNSLNKIANLRGVYYKVINDTTNKTQIGVIAQELEAEFPELVVNDENGYKSVAYDKITAVLIEAIKEQQIQIEKLELFKKAFCDEFPEKEICLN